MCLLTVIISKISTLTSHLSSVPDLARKEPFNLHKIIKLTFLFYFFSNRDRVIRINLHNVTDTNCEVRNPISQNTHNVLLVFVFRPAKEWCNCLFYIEVNNRAPVSCFYSFYRPSKKKKKEKRVCITAFFKGPSGKDQPERSLSIKSLINPSESQSNKTKKNRGQHVRFFKIFIKAGHALRDDAECCVSRKRDFPHIK